MKNFCLLSLLFLAGACADNQSPPSPDFSATTNQNDGTNRSGLNVQPDYKKLTFILTNDIHGHLEPSLDKNGKPFGGMAAFSTIVKDLRNQPEYKDGVSSMYVLDSGDQFQGTYISNFDEGKPVFKVMNEIGYDAIIPGNHDYDFGPIGWLFDKVIPGETSTNPREVIESLKAMSTFPLLSANTYYKDSIRQNDGTAASVDDECRPSKKSTLKNEDQTIPTELTLDFSRAKRPDFLKPYIISEKSGVKVALVGLDHHNTSATTTRANVSDLCFRDEVKAYLDIRRELEGKADVFVIIIHNGNSSTAKEASEITEAINTAIPNGVDLVAAGHTHFLNNDQVDGVPIIQDQSGAKMYGKVDLFFDVNSRKVDRSKTVAENIQISATGLTPDPAVVKIIDDAKQLAPFADQVLGDVTEPVKRHRIEENALGNLLTDMMRAEAKTDIAFYNAGGIREDLVKGKLLFKDFFEVVPFGNRAVVVNKMTWKQLKQILSYNIKTCNKFGIVNFSGIRIEFIRNCVTDIDNNASLSRVEKVDGTLIYDRATSFEVAEDYGFSLVTLDFLAQGGDQNPEMQIDNDLGLARDLIAKALAENPKPITNAIDGRLKNIAPKVAAEKR